MSQEVLQQICLEYQLSALYAFGSRALEAVAFLESGASSLPLRESDLDIGVLPSRGRHLSVKEKVTLSAILEDLFGVDRVDLINLSEADPFLAANIIRGERLYALNEMASDEYDLYVLRRAGDLIPFENERLALILESAA
ncbi:MAG: hypothetical protein A2511_10335 [Deltaproteobacteria bacterium RIFOXYD12_FULL_50_9]|nr:MAG: hypothetical protein A2511_10335 [Deltaproteobacteria bacterium RIFOXYD12_FULL_50_9]